MGTAISALLHPGVAAGTVVDDLTRRRLLTEIIAAAAPPDPDVVTEAS